MSNSNAHKSAPKRPYRLRKRAEGKDETRRRIVEAAVDLHATLGPARTTVADIARRAGVQRHTYYAHFPVEWDLFLACSGLALERDPLPDPEPLRRLAPGRERLRTGLGQYYGWFARNEQLAGCVLRDAEHHPLTSRIVDLRMTPALTAAAEILGEGLGARARALLAVAMEFGCWRVLARSGPPDRAPALMSDAILLLEG